MEYELKNGTRLVEGLSVYSFDLEPSPMKALAAELSKMRGARLDGEAIVAMEVGQPDGSRGVIQAPVKQWRKWFEDGTIVINEPPQPGCYHCPHADFTHEFVTCTLWPGERVLDDVETAKTCNGVVPDWCPLKKEEDV